MCAPSFNTHEKNIIPILQVRKQAQSEVPHPRWPSKVAVGLGLKCRSPSLQACSALASLSGLEWVTELLLLVGTRARSSHQPSWRRAWPWLRVSTNAPSSHKGGWSQAEALYEKCEATRSPRVVSQPRLGHRRQEQRWAVQALRLPAYPLTQAICCFCHSQGLSLRAGIIAKRATLTF